ncbi:carbohydrate kinase family protein [Streptomyces litchfieldiae]|uniref:Carbohydrate kinase family protein n=1 Tax=Streptomyces litchfieldiae TaxID=3075543 RepID=A0ABU2MS21_9ACTN|nr:carbohydrate kinase family protein [Streptomyces sp. DSM 44938]MDT0344143.1 carbohydrate kinase family protein [Streptomyces sp. DSM 44938]
MRDVLVIGGSGMDTIVRVERLEVPDRDLLHVEPIRDYVAHSGTGYALGFHALGLRTTFLDFLGEDAQGQVIRARFRGAGLDFDTLPAPSGTPRSVNLVDAEGRRFSFYDGRHPADLLMPLAFVLPHVERVRHVHVSRSHFNRELIPELERRGVRTSTDLHAWDGEDPATHPWAFHTDYVFLSAASFRDRVPEVLRMILSKGRARLVVATDGDRGCHVLSRESEQVRHYPAVTPPDPVVDSNGAGDAFATAFLHTLMGGGDLDASALAGLVAGAFACTRHGTHERHITAAELATAVAGIRSPSRRGPGGWRWS